MTTEQFEQAIVDRLAGDVTDVEVAPVPDDVGNYSLKHPNGALLVQYARSGFDAPRALNSISQTRSMRFSVFVIMRGLRDHKGAYAKLDAVRDSLTGFQPRGARKMYPLSERFLSEQTGIWIYEMVFTCDSVHEESQP